MHLAGSQPVSSNALDCRLHQAFFVTVRCRATRRNALTRTFNPKVPGSRPGRPISVEAVVGLATSASDVCGSAPASAAPATVRWSGGTGELSMILVDGRPVPAPASAYRSATPTVVVLDGLEVGAGFRNQAVTTTSEADVSRPPPLLQVAHVRRIRAQVSITIFDFDCRIP